MPQSVGLLKHFNFGKPRLSSVFESKNLQQLSCQNELRRFACSTMQILNFNAQLQKEGGRHDEDGGGWQLDQTSFF